MTDIQKQFQEALHYVKTATDGKEPNNQQKLYMYALFKQITNGPCNGSAPSKLKIIERAKYDEWKKLGNLSKDDAMKKYIDLVTQMAPNWKQKLIPKL